MPKKTALPKITKKDMNSQPERLAMAASNAMDRLIAIAADKTAAGKLDADAANNKILQLFSPMVKEIAERRTFNLCLDEDGNLHPSSILHQLFKGNVSLAESERLMELAEKAFEMITIHALEERIHEMKRDPDYEDIALPCAFDNKTGKFVRKEDRLPNKP